MSKIPNTENAYVADAAVALEIVDKVVAMRRQAVATGDTQEVTGRLANLYIDVFNAIRQGEPITK